jgi:hypothetical protein
VTLDVYGNLPPSLFETLYGLERNAEEFCYLFLRLLKLPAGGTEFVTVHVPLSFERDNLLTIILRCGISVNRKFGRVVQLGM